MGWLNINGNWIGRHSGKSWSSYWATRLITELIITPKSETEQTVRALTTGTGFDGVSFEYSSDNGANWSSAITDADGVIDKAELTAGVKYTWRARLYKGNNYSDYCTSNYGYTLDADTSTFITGLTTALTGGGSLNIINNFIVETKKDAAFNINNLSEVFDAAWILGGETVEASFRNVVERDNDITNHGCTHTPYDCVKGNGSDAYLDTGFNLSSESARYTRNSGSIGVYVTEINEQANVHSLFGSVSSLSYRTGIVRPQQGYARYDSFINGTTDSLDSTDRLTGLYIVNRVDAANHSLYVNNVLKVTHNKASAGVPDMLLYLLARCTGIGAAHFSPDGIGFAYVSQGLNVGQIAALTTHVHTLITELKKKINATVNLKVTVNPYDGIDFETINQYKANFHTHTRESDASLVAQTPKYTAEYHRDFGFKILALTDHDTYPDSDPDPTWPLSDFSTYEPSAETAGTVAEYYPDLDLLMIEGNELTGLPVTNHHRISLFNGVWTPAQIGDGTFEAEKNDIPDSLALIGAAGGLSILAHPSYHTGYDVAFYKNLLQTVASLLGIEVYNSGNTHLDEVLWDQILSALAPTKLAWGFSNSDDHNLPVWCGRNYNKIFMPALTGDALKSALSAGKFYFVYDPEGTDINRHDPDLTPIINSISLNASSDRITIDASNTSKVEWISGGEVIAEGESISLLNVSFMRYVRAKLTGSNGGFAFTQPFGLDYK